MLNTRTKIIFVEGVPGSGKSTFAQRLSFHLQQCGYKARWHHEHDRNHPAIPVGTPDEWNFENIELRLAGWKKFMAQAEEDSEVVILEGALFQKQLNQYVKEKKEGDLPALMDPLFRLLRKTSPILIQFRQRPMRAHFRWLASIRSGAMAHFARIARPFAAKDGMEDLALVCAYYSRIQQVSSGYARRFPGEVIVVNQAHEDWIGSFNGVCRKLGVPNFAPLALPPGLGSKLAGTYRREDGVELVVIETTAGRLRIKYDGALELVDRERLLFFIDNRPDEIRFELGPGAVAKLRMGAGTMLGTGTYPRTVPDRFTVERVFLRA